MAMEASLRLSSDYHHLPGAFVREILAMPESGATFSHKMVEITQFFDGLHLLIQEMNLNEVTQWGVLNFQSLSINRIYTFIH